MAAAGVGVGGTAVGGCNNTNTNNNNNTNNNRTPLAHLSHSHLLTLATLLDGVPKSDPFSLTESKTKSVSRCKGCDTFTICGLLFGYEEQENTIDIEKLTPTALHVACLLPQPGPLVARLVSAGPSGGASLNETNLLGQTPLHALLLDVYNHIFSCARTLSTALLTRTTGNEAKLRVQAGRGRKGEEMRVSQPGVKGDIRKGMRKDDGEGSDISA
ncbi:hypothetical protein Pmani_007897 [Petrolisthes manimaculis]|uniref:Uncharacterized protein n=1 Tax=Petrolisthes manimaculis TaxID=1843537 RepID=A0AAE1UK86_9EUCA|nr:hypothetical protein Pmani_007897 [Petrolisthes manimaculis]